MSYFKMSLYDKQLDNKFTYEINAQVYKKVMRN